MSEAAAKADEEDSSSLTLSVPTQATDSVTFTAVIRTQSHSPERPAAFSDHVITDAGHVATGLSEFTPQSQQLGPPQSPLGDSRLDTHSTVTAELDQIISSFNQENHFQVTIHALIPSLMWNWQNYSHLQLWHRGNQKVNSWIQIPLHDATYQHNDKCNAVEVTMTVNLPLDFLGRKISYTYAVNYHQKSPGVWEHLYDFPGNFHFSRCLDFSAQHSTNTKPKESCHIYDGFIFPPETHLDRIQRYAKSTGIHTKNSWSYAMSVFLHQVKVLETEEDKFDIYAVCENVIEIYHHMKQKKFIPSKGKDESLDEIVLTIGVQMWIHDVITRLTSRQHANQIWGAKVVIALAIIMSRTDLPWLQEPGDLKVVLNYLSLDKSLCCSVVGKIDDTLRLEAINGIEHIFKLSMITDEKLGSPYWEWLALVPLYHQLQSQTGGICVSQDTDPQNPNWFTIGIDEKKLKEFRNYAQSKRLIKKLFTELHSHLKDDKLLLRLLVYLSSEDDAETVLDHAPTHVYAIHISQICCETYHILTKEKRGKLCNAVAKLLQSTVKCVEPDIFRYIMDAVNKMLCKLFNICKNTLDDTAVLFVTIELYLCALSGYFKFSQVVSRDVQETITDVQILVMKWIQKPTLFFGECFGGKNGENAKNEIQLWDGFLKLADSDHISSCIQQEWKLQIQHLIKERVYHDHMKVPDKIKLAMEVCDYANNYKLDSIICDISFKAVANVMENDAEIEETRKTLATQKKEPLGAMLSTLLMKYYAKKDDELSTTLSFCLWPQYLRHYLTHDGLANEYSNDVILKCRRACVSIQDVSRRLEEGKVAIHELKSLTSHQETVINLFPQVVCGNQMNAESIKTLIYKRNSEVDSFKKYCSAVRLLLQYCEDIAGGEHVDRLKDGLKTIDSEEYLELKIVQLCEVVNGIEVHRILCVNEQEVMDMLHPFSFIMEESKSVISSTIWNHHITSKTVKDVKLSLCDIATKLWAPCLKEIQGIIEKFHDRSVTLQELDYYLKEISLENLESEVLALVEGCNKCFNLTAPTTWVFQFVMSVDKYRVVCQAECAAELVLNVKEALMLTGDFKKLENFQEKIIEHKTMSLEKFKEDGYYVEEVECLQEILSSNDRMDFLRVLSNSYPIIAWLRQETNDATELRNLIELSTFEDNVCAMDRIARLHTVGAQIAPLVYDLKENSDFDAFMKICEAVWLVLKANKSLAKSLEECCQDLPFFRQIKGLRMPVETGTYEQVKAIMEGGECCIGSKVHFTLLRVEEVVKIKTKGAKHSYTLIDLKELESRVVLIRDHSNLAMDTPDIADTTEIAGDHSAAIGGKLMSKDVEKFLNMLHFIVHISDTLICLQRAGNPQYVVWFESFACNLVKDDDLKCLNEKLKNDLQEWVATVSGLRKTIYPLNYFTCLQLLKISGEFYDLVSNSEYQLSKEVLLLLMSISPDLTIEDIRSVMSSSDAHRLVSKSINISSSLPTQNEDPSIVGGVDEEVLKLTEEEKTIFIAATTIYEFKPHLVLAALRCHGADVDEDSVVDWCYHNSSVEDEYITETPKIDGDNLTVKELIEYDFPKQLAIKAVEECGEDVVKCMDYCTQFILEKKNRHDESLSETSDTSLSRSNSVENVALDFCEKLNYIDIKGTGELLNLLMRKVQSSTVPISRLFANCFEKGAPNLVIVSPCDVLNAVISLYVHDMHSPLPSLEEVLICNHKTTVEELSLFWYKAVGDPDHRRIFCLVNGEKLSYQVCTEALDEMDRVLKGETDYRLVVVCGSKHKEEKSYIIDHLQLFRRDASAVIAKDNVISRYLQQNMKATSYNKQIFASDVDPDKCCARIVRSERSGMGKSLYISRIEEALQRKLDMSTEHPIRITIPIHGPDVDFDVVMTCLQDHLSNIDPTNPLPQIFHFDIAPSALNNAGALIFSMLVLKGFSDSSGKVWRCFKQQLYIIEATYAINIQNSDWNNSNNTYNFLKFIPTVTCCSPREAMVKQDDKHGMIYGDTEMLSSEQYQRPYQYLSRLTDHTVTLDRYSYTQMLGNNADFHELLHIVIRNFSDCDVHDPSWMEFRNFLYFLNAQLEDCENSAFCKVEIERDLPGFKTFVVQFMLKMAKDFAVPSLNIAMKHAQLVGKDLLPYLPGVSHPNIPSDLLSRWLVERMSSDVPDDTEDHTIIEQLQCHPSRVWDRNFHPYIFFNQDHDSLTFIGFSITENGDLIDPVSWNVLIRGIVSPKLSRNLRAQGVGVYGHNSDRQRTLLEELFKVIGIDTEMLSKSPDDSYVLTPDNAKKILAILMRFRCNIPVILMGETGCGKTRLIKYMCELLSLSSPHSNILLTLEVHGGVSEKDVVKKIHEAQKLARKNEKDGLETVLFFDEANTSKAIGLIKEVMCDKRVMGRPIKENIKFIAACNPYRRHSENMIKKLERAGLGYHVKSEDTEQKLGDVPLRNLVYRVLDIPSSMCSLVYDFGQLNSETEKEYTLIIVRKYVERDLSYDAHEVTSVLTACQEYMRSRTDECSFVSLRDIERAMIVLEWFNFILPEIEKDPLYQTDDVLQRCNRQTRALILSIAVCYYAKLQCREEFEEFIISQLYSALYMPMHDDEIFKKEVILCQEVVLNNMKLPPNIARNGALRENVFMMVVCIELKIPLFLVGKPGSSKSLAKSIVADAMQGAASRSPLFRKLKQIQLFSYQCSQHSTSESILEVFKSAAKFQEKKESQSSVSVVVLDEVGLAEDSPALPLKALHPLLEDGTAGTGDNSERVAFVGISNWALDPAKMNRGIMVTRDDPGVNELVLSARGICCSSDKENACEILETFFEPFATVYMKIYREQTENAAKEFFGLRDFYSLIKMMYGITQRTGKSLTMNQLQHCLKRNFGGTNGVNEIVERFLKSIPASLIRTEHYASDVESYPCDSYELIKTSLQLKDRSWNGETRYVLFLTENYSALRILQQTDLLDHDPLILFGSSFPEDVSYTQVVKRVQLLQKTRVKKM
ncbi:E3 ubiquitin-protein ligase rnf213-alpha-like isoform X2 [Dysidea avara]|uniref:E3 ubiquitin-protein ligase rnf213-alpha-like isoform X2 n=1 Tax=Dysidea avara TaxID=196820 RepID=UPI00331C2D3C